MKGFWADVNATSPQSARRRDEGCMVYTSEGRRGYPVVSSTEWLIPSFIFQLAAYRARGVHAAHLLVSQRNRSQRFYIQLRHQEKTLSQRPYNLTCEKLGQALSKCGCMGVTRAAELESWQQRWFETPCGRGSRPYLWYCIACLPPVFRKELT